MWRLTLIALVTIASVWAAPRADGSEEPPKPGVTGLDPLKGEWLKLGPGGPAPARPPADLGRTLAELSEAIRRNPADAAGYLARGRVHVAAGDLAAASLFAKACACRQ